eukprot:TRINITY_DN5922_c0_g1_i1.p1 TRINITY_DN5922_c0_g1~~TRINITY_DN5922_c0_g1_i1.p1  ORF type:complete len:470 (-),score=144.90 TRINITY_DN5922_c0_g1_i1:73-1482(-)
MNIIHRVETKSLNKDSVSNKKLWDIKNWLNDPFLQILDGDEEDVHKPFDEPQTPFIEENLYPSSSRMRLFKNEFGKEMLIEFNKLTNNNLESYREIRTLEGLNLDRLGFGNFFNDLAILFTKYTKKNHHPNLTVSYRSSFILCYDNESQIWNHFEHTDESDLTLNMCLINTPNAKKERGGKLFICPHQNSQQVQNNKSVKVSDLYSDVLKNLEGGFLATNKEKEKAIEVFQKLGIVPELNNYYGGERNSQEYIKFATELREKDYYLIEQIPFTQIAHPGNMNHMTTTTEDGCQRINVVAFFKYEYKFEKFGELNKNLKMHIIKFLSLGDLNVILRTSKEVNALADSEVVWKSMYERLEVKKENFKNKFYSKFTENETNYKERVKELKDFMLWGDEPMIMMKTLPPPTPIDSYLFREIKSDNIPFNIFQNSKVINANKSNNNIEEVHLRKIYNAKNPKESEENEEKSNLL